MGNNSRIIGLNRKRAAVSYISLKKFLDSSNVEEKNRERMKSHCRKLPVLIKINGLLGALSFIKGKSKEKNEYSCIYSWLENWLNELDNNRKDNIIERLITLDNYKYNLYTKEAIQISIWYKRHVEAML